MLDNTWLSMSISQSIDIGFVTVGSSRWSEAMTNSSGLPVDSFGTHGKKEKFCKKSVIVIRFCVANLLLELNLGIYIMYRGERGPGD